MRVRCINEGIFKYITEGKEYESIRFDMNRQTYRIVNDRHAEVNYGCRYFEAIQDEVPVPVELLYEDEEGVVEEEVVEEKPSFTVRSFYDADVCYFKSEISIKADGDIREVILEGDNICGNCGIIGYNGINRAYNMILEEIEEDSSKFMSDIVNQIVESNDGKCAQVAFSTNDEFPELWNILDEICSAKIDPVNNPNSGNQIKTWFFNV